MTTELAIPEPDQPPAPRPVPDLIAAWLDGRKASTVRGYRGDIDNFARWYLAPLGGRWSAPAAVESLLALGAGRANGIVLEYRNTMLRASLASATIARRLAALRSVVKLARTLGRVPWSIEVQAPPPEPRRDVRGPDQAGVRKLVKAARRAGDGPRAKRDRAVLALLIGLALRRGEVVALDLADVDFHGGSVAVLGKGKREKVALELPPEVSAALAEWVAVRGNHDGPLFTATNRPQAGAGRLTGTAVYDLVARLGRLAKLDKPLRPHGLRHSQITKLLSDGETVRDVMAFSRHAKLETVMRYDDALSDNAARLARESSKSLR